MTTLLILNVSAINSSQTFHPPNSSWFTKTPSSLEKMPKLLDLPNELLDQIIDDTIPEGIEAFAESSMHIYSLAQDRVDQHLDCLSPYCQIELSNHRDAGPSKFSPLELLKNIFQTPYLVRYPQQLTLDQLDNYKTKEFSRSDEFKTQVIKALVECRYVPSNEIENWATEICRGNYDAGTALLLTLLPNVRCLIIHGDSFIGYHVRHMVRCIVEASHDPQLTTRCPALSRLAKVHLMGSNFGGCEQSIGILAHLSALPSMNVLQCERVSCRRTEIPNWDQHRYDGGVTKIELLDSYMHPDNLSRLLQGVRTLRRFEYEAHARYCETWSPFEICQILQHHSKDTLEELDLTWHNSKDALALPYSDGLRGLHVLKKLRIRHDSIMSASENGTVCAAPLTSILPSSLEELRLVGRLIPGQPGYFEGSFKGKKTKTAIRKDLDHLTKLFDGLAELKKECLPNLVRIECENAYYEVFERSISYQKIRKACIRAGVALDGLPWVSQPVPGDPRPLTPQRQSGWQGSYFQVFTPDTS